MTAGPPRPSIETAWSPAGTRARVELVRRLAGLHARLTGGTLRRPVLSVLDRLLPPSPLPDVRAGLAEGVTLRLDGAGALARIALLCGGYEHRECEVLAGAVRAGGVFVDVGANVGWFSLLIAAHRPDATVWAIEPMPATAAVLRGNVAAARLSSIAVHEVALGAEVGAADLVVTADPAFAYRSDVGAGRSPAGRVARSGAGLATCPVTTLDRLWAQAGRPQVDAVKVDVEGAEPDVLTGAVEVLRACRPLLVVEAPSPPEVAAVEKVLGPLGYVRVARPGVLPYNLVFVSEEAP
jgi:FkbM family methyltransferase